MQTRPVAGVGALAKPASVILGMHLSVILNSLAHKNRGQPSGRSAALRHIIGPWGEVHETSSVDDRRGMVEFLSARVSHLISDGGDGTLQWLTNEVRSRVSDRQRWPHQ